ncbi:MAG: hypothetical protein ABUL62_33015 [Myxococcales bacterium]
MKIMSVALGALGVVLSAPAYAAVLIAPVEGTNLAPGEAEAISQTVASAYQVAQSEAVIPLAEARQAIEQTGGVQEAAKKLGASEYVYATAVRLDTKIVITATRYSASGAPLHSAKMTATGLDDVEPTSERLAKALALQQATSATQTLDTVTKTETKRPNRTWSDKVTGFKAGFTYPIGWGHDVSPMMDAGFALRVEGGEHFLEFGVGLVLPANASDSNHLTYGGVYGEIGANFYVVHASTSPYLGFGVMPRLMSSEVTNLAPYAQGGLMFFRESSTRMYLDLRVAQNVLPVGFSARSDYDSSTGIYTSSRAQRLYPTELTLHVGVGW